MGGVPGQVQNYIAAINGGNPAGTPGLYRVTLFLSKDAATDDLGISMDPNAHGDSLTDDAELPRSDDDALHTGEIHRWLPVLKYMARAMMRNDFPVEFPI
jgi:hypothetical protein